MGFHFVVMFIDSFIDDVTYVRYVKVEAQVSVRFKRKERNSF